MNKFIIKDFIFQTKQCLFCDSKTSLYLLEWDKETLKFKQSELIYLIDNNILEIKIRTYFNRSKNKTLKIDVVSHKYIKINFNKQFIFSFIRVCPHCSFSKIVSNPIKFNLNEGIAEAITISFVDTALKNKEYNYRIIQEPSKNLTYITNNSFGFNIKYFNIVGLLKEDVLKIIQRAELLQ